MSPLFRNRAREAAEAALKSCDATLAILESGEADLGPAHRLRERAAEFGRKRDYREAAETAAKAEATGKLLTRLYTAAHGGIARLKLERARMAKLGVTVDDLDRLIAVADTWMSRTVERDGDPGFPGYARAGEVALKGLKISQTRLPRFKATSSSIFEADYALRGLVESNRYVDPNAFEFFVLKPAADILQEAKGELRENRFEEATELARWTVATLQQIEATVVRVTGAVTRVAEGARALRSEGGGAAEVEDLLSVCRTALGKGKFDEASEIAERAGARLVEIRDAYRSLVLRMRSAEDAIADVEGWGFDAHEPRTILSEARGLVRAGDYEGAGTRLDEARSAAQGLRETHRTIAARILAMQRSAASLRSVNPSSSKEATELLTKAEGLLAEGRYRACEEDLELASLLLVDAEAARAARPSAGFTAILHAAQEIEPTCPTCGGPLANDGTCPTCTVVPEPENPAPVDAVAHAVAGARRVLAEIAREDERMIERTEAEVQGCAMCGGPLAGEDVLCAKCQGLVKGRA
ncbi:MAG: hypothetical protein E6K17_00805 [Methanobacteriota archaeon]|nr:MAG: hypothetical protein E6K17_00805 [Euryarchaeota archaeon]